MFSNNCARNCQTTNMRSKKINKATSHKSVTYTICILLRRLFDVPAALSWYIRPARQVPLPKNNCPVSLNQLVHWLRIFDEQANVQMFTNKNKIMCPGSPNRLTIWLRIPSKQANMPTCCGPAECARRVSIKGNLKETKRKLKGN